MRRVVCVIAAMFATIVAVPAHARDKINVAASFTILADFARNVGGTLYSDALTDANGPAPTYIDMMRHNVKELMTALGG